MADTLFQVQRYAVVDQLVDRPLVESLRAYTIYMAAKGKIACSDTTVPSTPAAYADPVMERLLAHLTLRVEMLCDLRLWPTYSYVRVYKHGDKLAPHVDRPACEISLSLNLGNEPDIPWPLWIRGPQGCAAVRLQPGAALLYRGIECPHWREPFEGTRCVQVFLHYVDAHGPYREHRYDKRDGIGLAVAAAG